MRVSLSQKIALVGAAWFCAAGLVTHSTADAQEPYDPDALSRLPVEDRSVSTVMPESPGERHPPGLSGDVAAVFPATISFPDAVRSTSVLQSRTSVRSHIQGEFPPEQLNEPGSRRDFLREKPLPAPQQPLVESEAIPLSPGDNVSEFDGLANTGWIPPDTTMGIGPSDVVEATNSGFAVYNKAGGQLKGYTNFESFFGPALPASWDGYLFDPRVIYSAEHARFVMLVLGKDDTNRDSFLFLAFPQTADPTRNWWLYRFGHHNTPNADADSWADSCGLGADTWGVYVTCNVFRWASGFKYAKLWSFDTDGFTGGTINGWVFWDLRWSSGSFAASLQPSLPHTVARDSATFFVNTFSSSGSSALLWKLTGDRTNSPNLTRATIKTPPYNAIGQNIDQPNTTTDLDGGDTRIMNAVYNNREVFTVLTDDVDNNGARAGWLTLKLNVDANSLSWSHLLYSGDGFYYFYPAITMEGAVGRANGNLAIFGSWTDADTSATTSTQFASALFKIYTNQPSSSDGPFTSYYSGLEDYKSLDSRGRNRWGDYSGAGFDWSAGDVWGAAAYAGTANTWRTRVTRRKISEGRCASDAFEPDDSSGQARVIATDGTPQTHNICPVGDESWVTFTLAEESSVEIETSGPAGNTRMWLYDAGVAQMQFDDDDGADLFSFIDRNCGPNALPAGTYYVKVDGDNEEIRTYNLAVTAADCP